MALLASDSTTFCVLQNSCLSRGNVALKTEAENFKNLDNEIVPKANSLRPSVKQHIPG